ncbi:hypothetical protein TrRE_jg4644 [Triparma retinervis]|uniref:HMG box domain-containing protein n=1 Tax=Triparma retinervis TaxID=2557542 RepID=A0A9W7CJJ1_9STRA|nr:hypothetical protein TrRE_jg4644 [Triparma retinervis]
MLAVRFQQNPIKPPKYQLKDVPPPTRKTLEGSIIFDVPLGHRNYMVDAMGEMVLLCKEVMKRNHEEEERKSRSLRAAIPSSPSSPAPEVPKSAPLTKPLSLEYIADRLDVDDPMFSFTIRTTPAMGAGEVGLDVASQDAMKRSRRRSSSLQPKKQAIPIDSGMLQGFVTATTFTNWQSKFRFNSLHKESYSCDPPSLKVEMKDGTRKHDESGELAKAIQSTPRLGDPYNEGIIYPRIAEISLAGGIKCGKYNYDYVVLQATDNSVPFYESMGFVRIGCIVKDEPLSVSTVVSSPNLIYKTKDDETPLMIATKLNVDVWDLIFLNRPLLPGLNVKSRLKAGSELFYPDHAKMKEIADEELVFNPKYHQANDNETPHQIAKNYNLPLKDLIDTNKKNLDGLTSWSRLEEGTPVQITKLGECEWDTYCHWSFPDESVENTCPSYMMARKLNRRNFKKEPSNSDPFYASILNAFRCPIMFPPKSSLPVEKLNEKNAFNLFAMQMRPQMQAKGLSFAQCSTKISQAWKMLDEEEKAEIEDTAVKAKGQYKEDFAAWKATIAEMGLSEKDIKDATTKRKGGFTGGGTAVKKQKKIESMFNKVVKRKSGWDGDNGAWGEEQFEFWYVLTFLPDLQWCHLAPLREVGVFGSKFPNSEGRPKYKLVPEGAGKEVDVSASECKVVKSISVLKTEDADEEEWDVLWEDRFYRKGGGKKNAVSEDFSPSESKENREETAENVIVVDIKEAQTQSQQHVVQTKSTTQALPNGNAEAKEGGKQGENDVSDNNSKATSITTTSNHGRNQPTLMSMWGQQKKN